MKINKYRKPKRHFLILFPVVIFLCCSSSSLKKTTTTHLVPVEKGWAHNSVNTVIFRKNSLVSFHDTQFIAYYNENGFVVLGKRKHGETTWQLKQTAFKGNVADAHNAISIMTDGDGYLHLAWDHHNNGLHYAKSLSPGSLDVGQTTMTGKAENKVSYPEFYSLPGGDLIFLYRDGSSGNGNLAMNHYSTKTKTWHNINVNVVDGEGKRNAYWQACTDVHGTIHLSWVWRESPDVASNHDICYARSIDGGHSWERSDGKKYNLPITEATGEVAVAIPENSTLINQTSMTADASGVPYIATYYREKGSDIPQYQIIYLYGHSWKAVDAGFRKTAFILGGAGTKRIPVSRPQVFAWNANNNTAIALVFRDEERNNKVSIALNKNINAGKWIVKDLSENNVGSWEPTYDTELWKEKKQLHLFVQKTEQADAEGQSKLEPQMIYVLECGLLKTK
jgi:hypothetical protein